PSASGQNKTHSASERHPPPDTRGAPEATVRGGSGSGSADTAGEAGGAAGEGTSGLGSVRGAVDAAGEGDGGNDETRDGGGRA
ncbi:MAG: serine/threonine protein kinase, partial [Pseudomonadota bacterium]